MVLSLLKALCEHHRIETPRERARLAPSVEEAYRLVEEQRAQYRGDTRAPNEAA